MKDVRISVRLSEDLHEKLKIISIKRKTNMNNLLKEYIVRLVKEYEKENN